MNCKLWDNAWHSTFNGLYSLRRERWNLAYSEYPEGSETQPQFSHWPLSPLSLLGWTGWFEWFKEHHSCQECVKDILRVEHWGALTTVSGPHESSYLGSQQFCIQTPGPLNKREITSGSGNHESQRRIYCCNFAKSAPFLTASWVFVLLPPENVALTPHQSNFSW